MAYLPGERPLVYPWQTKTAHDTDGSSPSVSGIRNFNIKLDVAGPASAYIEWGSGISTTKLIAVVKGPKQQSITRAVFDVEVSFASFANRKSDPVDLSRDLTSYIKEGIEGSLNLELYPYSAVTVYVKVLQCGESIHSLLSPALTAAVAACKHAGIAMKDDVVSVPIAITEEGAYLVDPEDSIVGSLPCASIGMTAAGRAMTVFHFTGVASGVDVMDSMANVADAEVARLADLIATRTH